MLKWDPFEICLHLNLRILGVLCSVLYIQEAITATCINPLEWDVKEHNFGFMLTRHQFIIFVNVGFGRMSDLSFFFMYIFLFVFVS